MSNNVLVRFVDHMFNWVDEATDVYQFAFRFMCLLGAVLTMCGLVGIVIIARVYLVGCNV